MEPTTRALYNGSLVFLDELMVPVNDRAYMFGDAIYEVLRVYRKKPFLLAHHMARLQKSLDAIMIRGVCDLSADISSIIAANNIEEGMVYVQVSRGAAPRNHSFYKLDLTPNILIYAKPFFVHPTLREAEEGITAITLDDMRWARCDIKTVNLLPNCLAQSKAQTLGVDDALLIRDGYLTEGTSSNVFVVKDNVIKTPPLSHHILPGIRRAFLIEALQASGHQVLQDSISKESLYSADEVFITSTIKEAISVVAIDGKSIGHGIGKLATLARKLIVDAAVL